MECANRCPGESGSPDLIVFVFLPVELTMRCRCSPPFASVLPEPPGRCYKRIYVVLCTCHSDLFIYLPSSENEMVDFVLRILCFLSTLNFIFALPNLDPDYFGLLNRCDEGGPLVVSALLSFKATHHHRAISTWPSDTLATTTSHTSSINVTRTRSTGTKQKWRSSAKMSNVSAIREFIQ
jgi:hypothetical protein